MSGSGSIGARGSGVGTSRVLNLKVADDAYLEYQVGQPQ